MATEIHTAHEASVQDESIASVSIISFVMTLLIGLGALTFFASQWFNHEAQRVSQEHATDASYPDLERLQAIGMQQINRYEMLEDGMYRIPVEQAMLQLAGEFPEDTRTSEEMIQ